MTGSEGTPNTQDGPMPTTCSACGHHISAFCGSCTVLIPLPEDHPDGMARYCGCDCSVHVFGESIYDTIRRAIGGNRG